jgi:hypothetical protein
VGQRAASGDVVARDKTKPSAPKTFLWSSAAPSDHFIMVEVPMSLSKKSLFNWRVMGVILILNEWMSKYFRPWKIDQPQLLPPSVQDFVPRDHLSRFIVELVRESLDLSEIASSYRSAKRHRRGQRKIRSSRSR